MNLYSLLHRRYGPASDALSRRDFIRVTFAAGAGLLLSGYDLPAGETKPRHGKRVLVLGAGLAGLSCAYELHAAGYDVTVLEGRHRLGGRVHTLTDFIPWKTVEAGGELIGTNHPLWLHYAKKFGLRLAEVTENLPGAEAPIIIDGRRLSRKEEEALWEEMQFTLNLMNRDATLVNADAPWKSRRAVQLDQRTTEEWLGMINLTDLCREAVRAQLENDNGVALDRQSYLGNLTAVRGGGMEKYWIESESLRCVGGNHLLALKFAESIGLSHIHLNETIKEIDLTPGSARVVATSRTFEADEVVCTLPPSVWRFIRFTPSLPSSLRPQMGNAIKYLSAVREPFWKKNSQSADSLGDDAVGWTWNGTAHQGGLKTACLTSFAGGPAAEKARSVSSDDRRSFYGEAIEKRFAGYRNSFIEGRFQNWPIEPFTRAGFSFPAPGQITRLGGFWQRPFAGKLHFAGEHTCYKFVGYMEGALQSGAAAAKRIARGQAASAAR